MELLDESKENIQPLRRGRNISTLNTALQAQTDAEIHHQLMKEREEFEVLVRSYIGDDPLKPWYDYVLWVEQNFPKHGREGNLKILLENCLVQFKDDEKYSQDVRYIDLWTRYMSFTDDPLEMYKQIHARGIGAQCAIFYQCWAEEFEKANDLKRADQIFIEGLKRNAQPKDELVAAHTNFQVRVARSVLGRNLAINQEPEIEERTALSTLRAHGRKKNMVDSTRIGNCIKRATPGVLRPHANVPMADRRNGNAQASKVAVYNDENVPFTDAVAHPVVQPSISLSQQKTNNKENTLKPGRWNEGKFKKKSSASAIGMSVVPATPRNPSFHVLADENADVPKTPKTDIVASNVLKMRRHVYEDEKNIPVAMFEPPDPKKVAMYPKSKVYSGGTEFSLEELRAIIYLKREKERQRSPENENRIEVNCETPEIKLGVSDVEVVSINGEQKYIPEEDCCQQMNVHQEVHISERTEIKQLPQNNNFQIYVEAEEDMNVKMKQRSLQNFAQKDRKPVVAPVQPSFLKDIPASGFFKVSRAKLEYKESAVPSTDDMFNSGPLFEQKESDQSLTVNTKAVLNDVKGMWVSSPQAEPEPPRASLAPRSINQARVESISTPLNFTPFKIFSDISTHEPEQDSSVNVHLGKEPEESERRKERKVEIAGHQKEVSQFCAPQKHTQRNLFNNPSSIEREQEVAEIRTIKQNSELSSYNERCIMKNFKQEPTSFPQNLSDCTPLRHLEAHREDFKIFKDPSAISAEEDGEMPIPSTEIPFVPSPGMTPAQLEALKGTEDKENMLRGKSKQMPPLSGSKKNILQPSRDVYFVPLEQQLTEDDSPQENVLSDETCCTEAFAIPLVSSTPMIHPHLKMKVQEEKPNQEDEDNTIALMALLQKNSNVRDNMPNMPSGFETTSKNKVIDQADVPELLYSAPGVSLPKSHLSIILESSEQKRSLTRTTDSSSSKSSGYDTLSKYNITRKSISSAYHQFCEPELQEEIEMFRNMEQNQRSNSSAPLKFFSGSFKNRCLESSGFPSELHKFQCVEMHMPFDTNISPGTAFVIGENEYRILRVVSEEKGKLVFNGFDNAAKRMVNIELRDNAYLWEQYIREEIRQRLRNKSMIKHFYANIKTYIFTDKFLRIFDMFDTTNLQDVLDKEAIDIISVASEILDVVIHLHQCKIVHGSLSIKSFRLRSDFQILFVNNFEKAVDLTLLPAHTVFDATEEPLYYNLRACKLSPFQVDYIALANLFHQLIFRESLKVHEEMGKWRISSMLPRNFDQKLWDMLFTELLNESDVDLLHLRYVLDEFMNKSIDL